MGRDPGKVISDGNRVKHNEKTGKVLKVMTDRRARVKWDDGTETIVFAGDLTRIDGPKDSNVGEVGVRGHHRRDPATPQ